MMNLTRWNPARDMEELHNRLTSVLDRTFGDKTDSSVGLMSWSPAVNISEDEKEYVIQAELPGLKREDVNVTFEDGVLSIAGERKSEKEQKGKRYHRVECSYGSFLRSFTLPIDTKPEEIQAEFKDGLLHVRVPKSEKARHKQIPVTVK